MYTCQDLPFNVCHRERRIVGTLIGKTPPGCALIRNDNNADCFSSYTCRISLELEVSDKCALVVYWTVVYIVLCMVGW